MRALVAVCSLAALPLLAACSPPLDWREVRVDDGGFVARFPCRPQRLTRSLVLAGRPVRMQMATCVDDGVTYAASFADVGDPAAVKPALEALRQAASANLGASDPVPAPFGVHGATPNPATGRIALVGRLPDGRVVQEHAAFFPRGVRVYQASLIGAAPSPSAVDGFFGGLAFRS